jgi:hypothetical protein
MSVVGNSVLLKSQTLKTNFTRGGLKEFLVKCQLKPHHLQLALEHFLSLLRLHYFFYFKAIEDNSSIRQLVPLLAAYSLFEYPVVRDQLITMKGIADKYTVYGLEKMGLLFIKSKQSEKTGGLRLNSSYLVLEIPFITLHIVYHQAASTGIPRIQPLYSLDSYLSSEECELSSLSILMFRLWAHHQISNNYLTEDQTDTFEVPFSKLLPLKYYRDKDFKIKYRANFEIKQAPYIVTTVNFSDFKSSLKDKDSIAYLNRTGASYGDAFVLTDPPIIIQEKQSILSRKRVLGGQKPNMIEKLSFSIERDKVQKDVVFMMITDERDRKLWESMKLGERDFLISWDEKGSQTRYTKFAGKLLSLRRVTQLGLITHIDDQMELD